MKYAILRKNEIGGSTMSKTKTKNKKEKEIKTLDSDYSETFDDIMNEILGEDNTTKKTDREEFEEKIFEVSRPYEIIEPPDSVEEIENTQRYRFADDARIGLFNGFSLDTGLGDGYREKTLIQTSHHLEITGHFNTRDLIIEKHSESNRFGQIEFNDRQKVDSLVVENVGLFGEFDVAIVSICDSSYIDIKLDISDKSKCTYLLIDTRFDRVRGKVKMSKDFYNQLNASNIDFLIEVNKSNFIDIIVGDESIDRPIEEHKRYESSDGNISSKYSKIKDMLNNLNLEL